MSTAKAPEVKPSIYELLPEVQRLIGNIGKEKKNSHQGYNFRGIDDVLNAIGPALAKVGVCCTAQVVHHQREEIPTPKGYRVNVILKLRVTFWGPDGSSLKNCTIGEAQDYNGDKATNKAMSVAFKYAAFMGLAIPVAPGCLDDSDSDDKPANMGRVKGTQPMSDPSPPQHEMSPQQKAAATRARNAKAKASAQVGEDKAGNQETSQTPCEKPQRTTTEGKEPPKTAADGKPIMSKQLADVRSMIKVITNQPPTGEDNIAKVKGILGHINGRRKDLDGGANAEGLGDLLYFEAEQVVKLLGRQMPKG